METLTFSAPAKVKDHVLSGMAHVFGTEANIKGRGIDKMAPGCFDNALRTSDVRAFVQHDPSKLLGSQHAGTVRLSSTPEGLAYEIDIPPTSFGQDLEILAERGDYTEMSFSFIPGTFRLSKNAAGQQVREHTSVASLIDISPVAIPAFMGTSAELRSADGGESIKSQLVRARARVHKE